MELRHGLLFVMVLYISIYETKNEDPEIMKKNSTSRYCGTNLSLTLSIICKGRYNTIRAFQDVFEKKNVWDAQYHPSHLRKRHVSHPFKNKAEAIAILPTLLRRKRRGVHTECCEKPCTREELSTYCAAASN